MPAEPPRAFCDSLHDVAPATLADCARILAFLDDLQFGPVALLVIPDFQGTGRNASWWSRIRALARLHAANPILRIALPPTDPRDTTFQRFWRNLRLGIDDRQVLTEDQLISRVTRRTVRSDSPRGSCEPEDSPDGRGGRHRRANEIGPTMASSLANQVVTASEQ